MADLRADSRPLDRRRFLAAGASGMLAPLVTASAALAAGPPVQRASDPRALAQVNLRINTADHQLMIDNRTSLLDLLREQLSLMNSFDEAARVITAFTDELAVRGTVQRLPFQMEGVGARFVWDPKYEMDRSLDRGVGDDHMAVNP